MNCGAYNTVETSAPLRSHSWGYHQ